MKRILIALMLLCFMGSTAYAMDNPIDHHERVFKQTQTFSKPVKEGTSKAGAWKDAPNVGLIDPTKAVYFFDDFLRDSVTMTANEDTWLATVGGTIQDDAPEGHLYIGAFLPTNVSNIQVNGESFSTSTGELWYETRFAVDQAETSNWFAGLAITDQTILAGCTDRIGFEDDGDDGNIDFVVEWDNVAYQLDTGFDMAASTMTRLGFVIDGSGTCTGAISWYVNDNIGAMNATCVPYNESLTPSFEVKVPTAGVQGARYLEIDYVKIIQER